ncbi:sulfite exporter TauE/SafE family protein [Marasmitruncus massiliensis]|uniref:sulfite exporter TauE/SafE family protein n=1 Tax=Marasmitruncus massiliensis TaxID=1944642 RepID=UPI000C7AE682|nr:sulfite exporter TauE/SafE family protein [Marasmitruncus massiliensis]
MGYSFVMIGLITLLSAFIQGCTGFGFSIIAMTLMPLAMPLKYAAAVTAISSFFMVASFAFNLRRQINFKLMLYPLISSTITSLAGVAVMMSSPDGFMRRILGLILILLSIYFIFFNQKIRVRQTPVNGLIIGSVSGILSGLFNMGGPPMVIYFLSTTDDKMEYNATLQCYFALNGSLVLILHLLMGNFNVQIAQYCGVSLIGIVLGAFIGFKIFKRITFPVIRKVVYGLMVVFGFYLLIAG